MRALKVASTGGGPGDTAATAADSNNTVLPAMLLFGEMTLELPSARVL